MLLKNKRAIVYGGGGAIGGAVARAFAREGATLFLAGRTREKLDLVARDITAGGGEAQTAQMDVLDEEAVRRHADAVASRAGGIDIAFNAVGILHVQGTLLGDLSYEEFAHPITAYMRANFLVQVFRRPAAAAGLTPEAMLAERARTSTLLHRFPTLAEVADAAAFMASDKAGAVTGSIVNLSCGSLLDY